MENLQAMQTSLEDGSTLQGWPYVQHEFFPGQGFKDASQNRGQIHNVNRPLGASATAEPHWIWEDFSGMVSGTGNTAGSKHWRDSWEWDSLSFTAQRGSPSCLVNTNRSPHRFEDQQLKSSSPSDKSEATMPHNESMSLELGLKNTLVESDGLLDLKLGGKEYAYDGVELTPSIKRSRHCPPESQHPRCQVDNCTADLKEAKDYHRRHKVCEVHAKALKAPVSRIMQRFCQQCSRFHLLQEFDEDRRSCRRRLAGHNRRRRKTQPDAAAALACLLADQNPLARLINPSGQDQGKVELERLLSLFGSGNALLPVLLGTKAPGDTNIQTNVMGGSTNDLIDAYTKSQLLSSLLLSNPSLMSKLQSMVPVDSSVSALSNALLQSLQQNYSKVGVSPQQESVPRGNETSTNLANVDLCLQRKDGFLRSTRSEQTLAPHPTSSSPHQEHTLPSESMARLPYIDSNTSNGLPDVENGRMFLNHAHSLRDEQGDAQVPANTGMAGLKFLRQPVAVQHRETIYQHTDPERTPLEEGIETAAPGSDQSSDSGLDKQEHTFQIWFKIFDRGPEDLPSTLRNQMLEWLEHLPTEMEGFIRPGCIILTVYIRMPLLAWEKLYQDTEGSLLKLVSSTSGDFWCKSRVLVQLGGASAFIVQGKVFLNAQKERSPAPHLLLVRPFAVIVGESANFSIKGYNLKAPTTKVVCAYDGKSVDKEVSLLGAGERKRERDDRERVDCTEEQVVTFNMGPMNSVGHGFIEVEKEGFKGNVFPFLVAEKSICDEISLLEEEFEKSIQVKQVSESVCFLYELGWLLERSKWRLNDRSVEIQEFSAARYRWLLCFAMEHNWRAVVKKILDLLFSTASHEQAIDTLSEVHLMHIAVRNNSRTMIEELAAYSPPTRLFDSQEQYIFRPDVPGPGGLTPLHIAASMQGADEVIDCLTNFPKELWGTTWTTGKDSVGQTPLGYALASDNCVYVRLVEDKLQKRRPLMEKDVSHEPAHTAMTIEPTGDDKRSATYSSSLNKPFMSSKFQPCSCRHGDLTRSRGLPLKIRGLNGAVYRPFVLSMLAVAVVCVCVGVLMKGPPNVYFVQPPFVWESIDFGFI